MTRFDVPRFGPAGKQLVFRFDRGLRVKAVWNTLLRFAREHTPLVKLLLKYGLGIGLLVYVIFDNWTGLKDVFRRPIHVEPLLLATGIASVGLIITFLRWHLLVRAVGLPFSRYNAIRLGLVGYYFNTFLPGSIGGDIVKAYAIAKEQSRRTVAVATVLVDRIIGLWALIWFVAIIGSVFWILDDPIMQNEILKAIILSTIVFCVASLGIYFLIGFLSDRRAVALADGLEHTTRIGWALSTVWRICWKFRYVIFLGAVGLLVWTIHTFWNEREEIWNTSKLRTRFIVAILFELTAVFVFFGISSVKRDRFVAIDQSLAANRKIGGSLAEFWRACWMYRQKSRAVLIAMIMSMVGHTGWVLVFHYTVMAFQPEHESDVGNFPEHMIVVPVGMTVQALIPVPGGIGAGEAAYGKLYYFIHRKPEIGVAGCMAQRVIFWGLGILGYIVYTRMRSSMPRKQEQVGEVQAPPDPSPAANPAS
jgi:uncharacterized membrane protein YbhN (UPF0104 family)